MGQINDTAATTNMLTKLYWRCPYYRYISNKTIRRENSNNKSCMFTVQKKKIFTRSHVDRYSTSTTRKTHIFINARGLNISAYSIVYFVFISRQYDHYIFWVIEWNRLDWIVSLNVLKHFLSTTKMYLRRKNNLLWPLKYNLAEWINKMR